MISEQIVFMKTVKKKIKCTALISPVSNQTYDSHSNDINRNNSSIDNSRRKTKNEGTLFVADKSDPKKFSIISSRSFDKPEQISQKSQKSASIGDEASAVAGQSTISSPSAYHKEHYSRHPDDFSYNEQGENEHDENRSETKTSWFGRIFDPFKTSKSKANKQLISNVDHAKYLARKGSTSYLTDETIYDIKGDEEFLDTFSKACTAMFEGVLPELITQGSSGSYFMKDTENKFLGVFKPRDEEPYGQNNPKWGKYFQKRCCPCAFGRGCLVKNTGYLSEAGASLVDSRLGLHVVPPTKVVVMSSEAFNNQNGLSESSGWFLRHSRRLQEAYTADGLPPKVGSFQVFVTGYEGSGDWLARVTDKEGVTSVSPCCMAHFQRQFERLVALDYVIRNTDRGPDNWLLRHDGGDDIQLAAIDHGLAFPFKHPNECRAYPYHWQKLPFAKTKFSEELRELLVPRLDNRDFVQGLCDELMELFNIDPEFDLSLFERQMNVLRGQMQNLSRALREGKSPAQLVRMSRRVVRRAFCPVPVRPKRGTLAEADPAGGGVDPGDGGTDVGGPVEVGGEEEKGTEVWEAETVNTEPIFSDY